MSDSEKWIDSTKRSYTDKVRSDKQMMEAVMAKEHQGWTRISSGTLQYIHPNGSGFVMLVRGEWRWITERVGEPRKEGVRTLLESALQDVQNIINP